MNRETCLRELEKLLGTDRRSHVWNGLTTAQRHAMLRAAGIEVVATEWDRLNRHQQGAAWAQLQEFAELAARIKAANDADREGWNTQRRAAA